MAKLVSIGTALALSLALAGAAMAQVEKGPQTQQAAEARSLSLSKARAMFASAITATGRVLATTSARIGPRVSGRLATFGTSADGQPLDVGMSVKAGDVLFRLDQTTFANAQAMAQAQLDSAKALLANLTAPTREERIEALKQDVAQLDARVADRTRERERYKHLVEDEKTLPARRLEEVETDLASLSAQEKAAEARLLEAQHGPTPSEIAVAAARVKEAEAALKIAQDDLRDATVVAPFSGVVTQRFKSVGDYLVNMPPTDVMELVSVDRLEAEIAVPESYMPVVQSGSTRITLRSPLLKQQLELPVTRVVGQVDSMKGTFIVRVAIPADQRQGLVAGAFVTADLALPRDAGAVIAPARAIEVTSDKPFVYVARDGKMVKQTVELGDKLSEGVIITAGVKDGEPIVLGPADQLEDGKELPAYLK